MDCKVQPWVGFLIPLCDGKLTVRQLLEACKSHQLIHAETPLEEFSELLAALISGGFLEVADFRPPHPKDGEALSANAKENLQNQPL
jgi:hypothetical protein